MFRLFRRPPREDFELDTEDAAAPSGGEEVEADAEGEPGSSPGRRQRPLKTILALGIIAVGLGALYLSWSGGGSDEPAPPRLLPQGRASLTQDGPPVKGAPAPVTSSPSPTPAPPSAHGSTAAPQAQTPTFYQPLQRDPRDISQSAAGQASGVPTGGAYTVLVQASHEATVENLRAQIAELKLKTLRAELEADQLRKNPRRLFKDDRIAPEPKKEPSALERLARVPPPMLPMPGPIAADRQAQPLASAAPPAAPLAPPQMRVRMVTLEPKEALIEAGDAESRGWFKVHEGQKFPDFVITGIGEEGVTISFAGRGFFYPVGGYALGVPPDNRQAASRQASDPTRR